MEKFILSLPLNFESKLDIFMLILISLISTILMIFVGYKLLQMLQLSGYKLKGYCRWFKETKYSYLSRLFMLSFLSTSAMLMTNVLLEEFFVVKTLSYVGILFYILFSSLFITNLFSAKQKTPLIYTKRIVRLLVVFSILLLFVTFSVLYLGFMYVPYISFGLIGIIPVMLPLFVFISYFITYPIEKLIANSYIKKAKAKINNLKNLRVIGVTGSYAKTTVKNILHVILSEKFKVCSTPSSYNTPLGLSKTILSKLNNDDEIFIAEMGAKQRFDIKELCELVNPEIAVITGVGNQHLLTFGSLENIIKTKSEVAEFVANKNGKIFINTDSYNARIIADNYKNSIKISINEDCFVKAENIIVNQFGSSFDIVCENDKISCSTKLIGVHNISNILLSVSIALDFGLSLQEISSAISKIKPIKHRLEIIDSKTGYVIIDDSYNCSVEGSRASLNVLSNFDGKKIIITPGLIELGHEQYNANFEFGQNMAKICDYVIIDSQINFDALSSGLISSGFNQNKILQAASLSHAVDVLNSIVQPSDVVLFENDLPDNYS